MVKSSKRIEVLRLGWNLRRNQDHLKNLMLGVGDLSGECFSHSMRQTSLAFSFTCTVTMLSPLNHHYMCVCVCVCVCIYIYREREREFTERTEWRRRERAVESMSETRHVERVKEGN